MQDTLMSHSKSYEQRIFSAARIHCPIKLQSDASIHMALDPSEKISKAA